MRCGPTTVKPTAATRPTTASTFTAPLLPPPPARPTAPTAPARPAATPEPTPPGRAEGREVAPSPCSGSVACAWPSTQSRERLRALRQLNICFFRISSGMDGSHTVSACQSPLSWSVSLHRPTPRPAMKAAPRAVVSATLGLTSGTLSRSERNCIIRELTVPPPSTRSLTSGILWSLSFCMACATSTVWKALASKAARTMCALVLNAVKPTITPLASPRQYGANSPAKAGTKYTPPLSGTDRASASLSSAFFTIPRLSLSH
mmetsp:Transcript_19942/g.43328  ORF Transcript_19942/g.43328 Transcript_19942/m.43328 type:complete len:261 (+) Transcript_19942:311-1093(+)